jgi:hypothetical protein
MKPIDILGMGPRREVLKTSKGTYLITVIPPDWTRITESKSIELTPEQYDRYLAWDEGGLLIQDALPDLTNDQREILITGT